MTDALFHTANSRTSTLASENFSFSNISRLLLAPASLCLTWYGRARLRKNLAADLRERPEYLRDIGICEHAARSEAVRLFWEPILLKHHRFEMAASPAR
jgi:uncharacterized protein YjiS (DUF1127 family)